MAMVICNRIVLLYAHTKNNYNIYSFVMEIFFLELAFLSLYLKMFIGFLCAGFDAKKKKIFPLYFLFVVFSSTCTIGTNSMFVRSKRNKERYKTCTFDQSSVNAQSLFYSKCFVFLLANKTDREKNHTQS